jgi:hypothetical protein
MKSDSQNLRIWQALSVGWMQVAILTGPHGTVYGAKLGAHS